MRKGFTLVELIVVIMILPFVLLVIGGLFQTIIKDIPQSYRIAQENTILLDMLEQLRQDTDRAQGLPESLEEHEANENMLLIALEAGVISYQLEDGRVIRRNLADARRSDAKEPRVWSLPHTRIMWRVWARDGQRYAVETSAHIEQFVRGQWKEKMANSHLYFAGSLGKALAQK